MCGYRLWLIKFKCRLGSAECTEFVNCLLTNLTDDLTEEDVPSPSWNELKVCRKICVILMTFCDYGVILIA